jgi:hypothetical protein
MGAAAGHERHGAVTFSHQPQDLFSVVGEGLAHERHRRLALFSVARHHILLGASPPRSKVDRMLVGDRLPCRHGGSTLRSWRVGLMPSVAR